MPASIKDIANRLNISVSTVSYALNGGPRSVSPETRDQVLAMAKDLDYRPNRIARSMVTGRTNTIGVMLPAILDDAFLSPYLHLALNGIANEAGHLHQDMLLFTRYGDENSVDDLYSSIADKRVDGVVFLAPNFKHREVLSTATEQDFPCVTISTSPIANAISFAVDNEEGIFQAMQHLYDLGHRKIGHIAGRLDMDDGIARKAAYEKFMRDHGLAIHPAWCAVGDFVVEGGTRAAHLVLSGTDVPTALVCANDESAIGALIAAAELDYKVPHDISIVGFDNVPNSGLMSPGLTTLSQPISTLSSHAVRALVDQIEGRTPPKSNVFKTELIVRGSTCHPKKDIQ